MSRWELSVWIFRNGPQCQHASLFMSWKSLRQDQRTDGRRNGRYCTWGSPNNTQEPSDLRNLCYQSQRGIVSPIPVSTERPSTCEDSQDLRGAWNCGIFVYGKDVPRCDGGSEHTGIYTIGTVLLYALWILQRQISQHYNPFLRLKQTLVLFKVIAQG